MTRVKGGALYRPGRATRATSSAPGWHARPAYPQKPLQELPGAADVDAGDVAVPPEHAVHGGRDFLPVCLGLRIELFLVFYHFTCHAVTSQGSSGAKQQQLNNKNEQISQVEGLGLTARFTRSYNPA